MATASSGKEEEKETHDFCRDKRQQQRPADRERERNRTKYGSTRELIASLPNLCFFGHKTITQYNERYYDHGATHSSRARAGTDLGSSPIASMHSPYFKARGFESRSYADYLSKAGSDSGSINGFTGMDSPPEGAGFLSPSASASTFSAFASGSSDGNWAAMEAARVGGGEHGVTSWSTFDEWRSPNHLSGQRASETGDGATFDLAPPMRLEQGFLLVNYAALRWFSGDVVTQGNHAALVSAGTEALMFPQWHTARVLQEPDDETTPGSTHRAQRGGLLTQWEDNDASIHQDLGGFA